MERILIVAPAWIGDAILSEPLVALVRDPFETPIVDVLAPAWCAPVYARMRGIGRIIETTTAHGRLDLRERKRAGEGACRPWLHACHRAAELMEIRAGTLACAHSAIAPGYVGEARYGLLNDIRRLQPARRFRASSTALPRLRRDRASWCRCRRGPVLVPDLANRAAAVRALRLRTDRKTAILCPGRRIRTGQAVAADAFRRAGRAFSRPTACRCGSSARPTTSSRPSP